MRRRRRGTRLPLNCTKTKRPAKNRNGFGREFWPARRINRRQPPSRRLKRKLREPAGLMQSVFHGNVANHFHCDFSQPVHHRGGDSSSFLDGDFTQSECAVLGRDKGRDVFCARGRSESKSFRHGSHTGGRVSVCGEPHEFGGCAGGGRGDSAADRHFAEEIFVCVSDRGTSVYAGAFYSGGAREPRVAIASLEKATEAM